MEWLFGLVGFMLGAGLLYWLQNRKLETIKRRLEHKKTEFEQTEALNRQQTAKLQKLQQSQLRFQELEQTHAAQIQQIQAEHQAELEQTKQNLETAYQSKIAEIERAASSNKGQNDREQQPPVLSGAIDAERAEAPGKRTEIWEDNSANGELALLDVLLEEGEEEATAPSPLVNGFSPESAAELVNPWEKTLASGTDSPLNPSWKAGWEVEAGGEEEPQLPLSNPFLAETAGQNSQKDTLPLELELAELFAESEQSTDGELDFLAMLNLEGEEGMETAEASTNGHANQFQELLATDTDRNVG